MTPPVRGGLDQALLLEQVSWIRRLARELVADRDLAEDLVQETCVVAMESAPRESGKLRAWLAQVLRNALRQHARSGARRALREAASARPEEIEGTAELVERVALQRELVGRVLELEEPYRSTVLLRFFEDLPPREIARRTGVPVATVQSRLTRALARLRERLDGEHGAWATLLLPWLKESISPPTLIGLVMKTKLTVAAAAAALAAGAFVWWNASPEETRARSAESVPVTELERPSVPGLGAWPEGEARPSGREALAATPGNASAAGAGQPAPEPGAAPWTVRLRVLDAEAVPLPGVAIRSEASEAVLGTSGAGGWCTFETRAEGLVLSAADPRWVTIHEGSPSRAGTLDPVLVLAPVMQLSGRVVDGSGNALAGARVRFQLPEGFHARFTEILEATRPRAWLASSDAEGGFVLERVPAVAGSHLRAVLAGYEMDEIEAPPASARDLELVLFRPRVPLAGVLRGKVLEPAGAFARGARVGLGLASVVTDEQGDFAIDLGRAVTADVLTAVAAGFLPARLERPQEPGQGSSGWPDHVVLVLGGPALSIRGVVVDEERRGVSGAKVWLHDPTPSTPVGQVPAHLENLMAGAPLPPQALESEASLPDEDGDHFWDWHTTPRDPTAFWSWVVTDATGGFELSGLDRRSYRLDVLRPDSLEVVTSPSIRAGTTDAVVELGPSDVFERVSGRVLSEDGAPVPGVTVTLFRPTVDVTARVFGGRSQVVTLAVSGSQTSDAEGRFEFEGVPRSGAQLSVRSDGIVPRTAEITAAALDVPVEVRCHLEVVLRHPMDRFDRIKVYDGEGQRLDILVLTEGSVNAWTDVSLVDGRSGVVSVSSRARELQLFKDGTLVETRPLDLVPGEVNRVEP